MHNSEVTLHKLNELQLQKRMIYCAAKWALVAFVCQGNIAPLRLKKVAKMIRTTFSPQRSSVSSPKRCQVPVPRRSVSRCPSRGSSQRRAQSAGGTIPDVCAVSRRCRLTAGWAAHRLRRQSWASLVAWRSIIISICDEIARWKKGSKGDGIPKWALSSVGIDRHPHGYRRGEMVNGAGGNFRRYSSVHLGHEKRCSHERHPAPITAQPQGSASIQCVNFSKTKQRISWKFRFFA